MPWIFLILFCSWSFQNAEGSWQGLFSNMLSVLKQNPEVTTEKHNDTVLDTKYYDAVMDEMLNAVIKAHDLPHNREKRAAATLDYSIKDNLGVHRLQYIMPYTTFCDRQLYVSFVSFGQKLYVLCLSAPARENKARLSVGVLQDQKWTPIATWLCENPKMVVGFPYKNRMFIVIADQAMVNGAELLYFDGSNKLKSEYTIHSRKPTAVALWKMSTTGDYNLALANSEDKDYGESTFIYSWEETYFDKYASVVSREVSDLEPFSIHHADYLAVVNHYYSPKHFKVDSVVYKYDLSLNTWKVFQQIPTLGGSDAQFFTLGKRTTKDYFLAIANQYEQYDGHRNYAIDSVIYKYVEGKFVPFQCLHTTGATKIATYEGPDGEFLLAVSSMYDAVSLYQYNGWHFIPTPIQYTQMTMGPGARQVLFHHLQQTNEVLLAVSNPGVEGPGAYKVTFYHDNQIQRWYDGSLEWCQESSKLAAGDEATKLASQLDQTFYVDRPEAIHLNSKVVFEDLSVAEALRTPQLQDLAVGETYNIQNLEELEKLNVEIEILEQKLKELTHQIAGALKTSGNQVVSGNYHFEQLEVDCPSPGCHVVALNTNYLNKESVSNLKGKVLFLDSPQTVFAPMSFEKLTVNDLRVEKDLNGQNISNYVTLHGNHEIMGNIRFMNPVRTRGVTVTGTLGGIRFSPDSIMLTEGNQALKGDYTFTDLVTKELQVDGTCNGLSINEFYKSAVTFNGAHVITGKKVFQKSVVTGMLTIEPNGFFNGVNLDDLWRNVMWLKGDQVITAPHTYNSVKFTDVEVQQTINQLLFPGPDVILINQDIRITAEKIFKDECTVDELMVTESLNGLRRVPDEASGWKNQLDILLKTPVQTVFGKKTFTTIHLGGHSTVGRYVDNIDLSEFAKYLSRRTTQVMNGTWVFNGNVKFLDQVSVAGNVNNYKLEDLYKKALRLDAPIFPKFDRVILSGNVLADQVTCHDINGFDIPNSFVLRRQNGRVIRGPKNFEQVQFQSDLTVEGLLNTVSLESVKDALQGRGNQKISGTKTFKNNLRIKNLVANKINNVPFSEFCRLDDSCVFEGPKTFEHLSVLGGLSADNLIARHKINDILVHDLLEDTMLYSKPQTVGGTKTFTGNLTILKNSNIQTDNLSGVDLSELYRDAVLLNVPQGITGEKTFTGLVTINNLESYSTIDGVTRGDMSNWLLQGVDQAIIGDVVFEKNLVASKDLIVHGPVNDMNLKELHDSIAYKNKPTTFTGPMTFEYILSKGNVDVAGTVQGVDVSEEVVTRSKDVTIKGRKRFKEGFTVNGDMFVAGLFDSVRVEELCAKTVRTVGKQTILAATTIVGNVTFQKDLKVGGLVDGVNLREVDASCLKKDAGAVIRGYKTFQELIIESPIQLRGYLNNINVQYLKDMYMSLTKDQIIEARLTMPNMDIHGQLHAAGIDTPEVNGVNLPQFMKSVMRTEGDQVLTGPCKFKHVVFKGDLTVRGPVNGVRVPEDIMTKTKNNVISGPLQILGNVNVTKGLIMPEAAKLQGVDVPYWDKNAVYNDGREYILTGTKKFNNLNVADAYVSGLVDGVPVSRSTILLKNGDQVITGHKVIQNDLAAENLATAGSINGIDLREFENQVLLKGRNNTVTGHKKFVGQIKIATLTTYDKIDNISLEELKLKTNSLDEIRALGDVLRQQQKRIEQLQQAFADQAVVVSYYEKFIGITTGPTLTWGYSHLGSEDHFLLTLSTIITDVCTPLKVFRLQQYPERLLKVQGDILIAHGFKIQEVSSRDGDFVFVANRKSVDRCIKVTPALPVTGEGNSSVAILRWNQKKQLDIFQIIKVKTLVDIFASVIQDQTILVTARNAETDLWRFDPKTKQFVVFQVLEKLSVKVSAVQCSSMDSALLAVATSVSLNQPATAVSIYHWDRSREQFVELAQLPAVSVSSLTSLHFGSQCLVVVGQDWRAGAAAFTSVYKYISEGIPHILDVQKIEESAVVGLDWTMSPDDKQPLLFLQTRGLEHNIRVYSHKGASGFVLSDTVEPNGFKNIRVFRRKDGRHLLALAENSDPCSDPEIRESAVLLQSRVKGGYRT